eukprot:4162941-Amphidinium_carterae.1
MVPSLKEQRRLLTLKVQPQLQHGDMLEVHFAFTLKNVMGASFMDSSRYCNRLICGERHTN